MQQRFKKTKKKTLPVATKSNDVLRGSFIEQKNLPFDSTAIHNFIAAKPIFKSLEADLFEFYRTHHFNYVWFDKKGLD